MSIGVDNTSKGTSRAIEAPGGPLKAVTPTLFNQGYYLGGLFAARKCRRVEPAARGSSGRATPKVFPL